MTSIADQVAAYLDGDLTPAAARRFERELLRPEVSRALSEELALRELLRSLPIDEPPEWLESHIEDALGVSERRSLRQRLLGDRARPSSSDQARERDPNYAAAGMKAGADSLLGAMGTLRYAAGPLSGPLTRAQRKPDSKPTSSTLSTLRKLRAAIGAASSAVGAASSAVGAASAAVDGAASAARTVNSVTRQPLLTRALGLGRSR